MNALVFLLTQREPYPIVGARRVTYETPEDRGLKPEIKDATPKRCATCGAMKTIGDFYRSGNFIKSSCKLCLNKRSQERHRRITEKKRNERLRAKALENPK